jgi:hypothetical protein
MKKRWSQRGQRASVQGGQHKALDSSHGHRQRQTITKGLRRMRYLFLITVLMSSVGAGARAETVRVWEVPVGYFFVTTPATGDVDGDARLDIVVTASGSDQQPFATATSGLVTAVASDGTILPGWPVMTNEPVGFLSPTAAAVADLDGDGRGEVIFGHGHSLYVFRGDGQLLWQRQVDGFFKKQPVAHDLDGDGQLEVINSTDQFLGHAKIYIWRSDGEPYPDSPLRLREFYASSPAVSQEAGCTLLAVGGGNGFTATGGSLYLFAWEQGQVQLRWQLDIGHHPIAKPTFADLDGDGSLDIVGGTYTPSVYAVRVSDGRFIEGWPQPVRGSVFTSPAVIRHQGQNMILAMALDGMLYAWDYQGLGLWTVEVEPNAIDHLTLADINSDGEAEVILGVNRGILVIGTDGTHVNRWELGNYWVTAILTAPLDGSGTSTLILGGVDNETEEAKLFLIRP